MLSSLSVMKQPDVAENWFWLAASQANKSPTEAIKSYLAGLSIDPNNANIWIELGKLFTNLDDQTALHLYKNTLADFSQEDNPIIRKELRFLWAKIVSCRSPDEGIILYQDALVLYPYDGLRWRELGDLLVKVDPDAAIGAYLQS